MSERVTGEYGYPTGWDLAQESAARQVLHRDLVDCIRRGFLGPPQPKCPLGNPQLGLANPLDPNPWVHGLHGEKLYQGQICPDCQGYYFATCPCWFRTGGRHNRY